MTGDPLGDRVAALAAAGRGHAPPAMGLGEIAIRAADEDPGRVVVSDGQRDLTRGEILEMALRLGGGLRARGIARGAALAFQLPNWWEACVVNLAAALFGYRIVPLLPIYRSAELDVILPACRVDVIFVPARYRDVDYPGLIAGLESPPRHILTVRGAAGADSFEALLDHPAAEPELPPSSDAKLIIFTSGSTGWPKGVIHTHDGMDAIIRQTGAFWGIGAGDILYVPSPIGHIGGSIYAFEFPWITGCRTILADRWDADRAVADIAGQGATFMAGATPFLSGLIEAADRAGTALPSLRRFICGGASVPPELVRRGLERFPNAVVSRAYGSSEAPLACPGIRTRAEAEARADTDGEVAMEVRLLDEAGAEAGPGAEGEIAVRGPQLFLGYLDPGDDAECFTEEGFFRMGDLGRLVAGRFVVVTGRKKDIIIRKGENISPVEIETALLRHPAVQQVAVVGTPDRARGEIVVAFVVPAPGAVFGMAEMSAYLATSGLARQKHPEVLHAVDALPMNAVGKVLKPDLRIEAARLHPA